MEAKPGCRLVPAPLRIGGIFLIDTNAVLAAMRVSQLRLALTNNKEVEHGPSV